tara:strand:+ start:3398 stop:3730 length:333 start_codon:yes stop_codon:yes gene_type:complete
MSRYNSRRKAINKNEKWEKTLEERGVKQIEQYVTPRFKNPTEKQLARIITKEYMWKTNDRYWRIAARELGDASLWWVIAKLNNKPTEAMLDAGDIIKIPLDIGIALEVLG